MIIITAIQDIYIKIKNNHYNYNGHQTWSHGRQRNSMIIITGDLILKRIRIIKTVDQEIHTITDIMEVHRQ